MVLKVMPVPVTEGHPKQVEAYFEGETIIKTGTLVGDLDEIMKDNEGADMLCPTDIEPKKEVGTIHFDIRKYDGSTQEVVIAHCDAYLINDKGKTVDHFTCR